MSRVEELEAIKAAIYEADTCPLEDRAEAELRVWALVDAVRGTTSREQVITAIRVRMKDYRSQKVREERAKLPPRG